MVIQSVIIETTDQQDVGVDKMAKKSISQEEKDKVKRKLTWLFQEVSSYEERMGAYHRECDDIEDIYFFKNGTKIVNHSLRETQSGLLFSNIKTMLPTLYGRAPMPFIKSRFKDIDPIINTSAQTLERCAKYVLEKGEIYDKLRSIVEDYLLFGRAILWTTYKAVTKKTGKILKDENDVEYEEEILEKEFLRFDVVHRNDFGHAFASSWDSMPLIWKKAYITKGEFRARFGNKFDDLMPNATDDHLGYKNEDEKRSCNKYCVYEFWDKTSKKVYWALRGKLDEFLDEKEDFAKLEDFFPIPKPLYSTVNRQGMIPTPDYTYYKHLLADLEACNAKISHHIDMLKVFGVVDGSIPELERILTSEDGKLIPIKDMAKLVAKGGLEGVVDVMLLSEVVTALQMARQEANAIKQNIFEVLGIPDLVRGQGKASESAEAQGIKGDYVSVRFKDQKIYIANFMRDWLQIVVSIFAKSFSQDMLKEISGLTLLDDNSQKEQILQQMQLQGMQPSPEQSEILSLPTWEEIVEFLRDYRNRDYRIDIETVEAVQVDEAQEKAQRMECLQAIGAVLQQAMPAIQAQPKIAPLMGKLIEFTLKSFHIGASMQEDITKFVDSMIEISTMPPQQPQEQPKEDKLAQIQAKAQADSQLQSQKHEQDMQKEQMKAQVTAQTQQYLKQMDASMQERFKGLEANIKMIMQDKDHQLQNSLDQRRTDREISALETKQQTEIEKTLIANQNKGVSDANKN